MPTKKGRLSRKERIALKGLALGVGTTVATMIGGPQVGASWAAMFVSPVGQIMFDAAMDDMEKGIQPIFEAVPMAEGGLITSPTLALLGEAGPELVVPLAKPKRTRKKTDYDRRLRRALNEINIKARLKNGSFRKGWDQSKVMKKAHKLARKYGPSTKKGQVRKTARRAYRK